MSNDTDITRKKTRKRSRKRRSSSRSSSSSNGSKKIGKSHRHRHRSRKPKHANDELIRIILSAIFSMMVLVALGYGVYWFYLDMAQTTDTTESYDDDDY